MHVLYSGNWGGKADGDDEHVQEGGVWGSYQDRGMAARGLLSNY